MTKAMLYRDVKSQISNQVQGRIRSSPIISWIIFKTLLCSEFQIWQPMDEHLKFRTRSRVDLQTVKVTEKIKFDYLLNYYLNYKFETVTWKKSGSINVHHKFHSMMWNQFQGRVKYQQRKKRLFPKLIRESEKL